MYIIFDDDTLTTAWGAINDRGLSVIINHIVHSAKAANLWEVTCILVIDPTDRGEEIESVLGFDPLIGPLGEDGEEFIPWWDRLEHHPGYFELLHTTGTDFAYYLLVPDAGPDQSGLAALCRLHWGVEP